MRALLLTLMMMLPLTGWMQVRIRVLDAHSGEAIPEAAVLWKCGSAVQHLRTDSLGLCLLPAGDSVPVLTIHRTGYLSWTGPVLRNQTVHLSSVSLQTVSILSTEGWSSRRDALTLTRYAASFFNRLPGNQLMDKLDYIPGVRTQTACGVCGTNSIQINGMPGPYTLLIVDDMPVIGALGSVYGLNSVPASLLDEVVVEKGPSALEYGGDGMAGTIRVYTPEAHELPRFRVGYQNSTHLEQSLDLSITPGRAKHLLLSAQAARTDRVLDANGDGFRDMPQAARYSLFTRWQPAGNRLRMSLRLYHEDRMGGELSFSPAHKGSDSVYGEYIRTQRLELGMLWQVLRHTPALQLRQSLSLHGQDSYYGATPFRAGQVLSWTDLRWQRKYIRHAPEAGISLRCDRYDDHTPATASGPQVSPAPGIWMRDTWTLAPRLRLSPGLRADWQPAHGLVMNGRAALQYSFRKGSEIGLTGGSGYRNVHVFTEDHAALTGTRQVVFAEALRPERLYSLYLNARHVAALGNTALSLNAEAFYTYFRNRILPDYNSDPQQIRYQNLSGYGQVRGISGGISQQFSIPLQWELAGTWLHSGIVDSAGPAPQLFIPDWTVQAALNARMDKAGLSLNFTGSLTGPMHLPQSGPPWPMPERSPVYAQLHLQLAQKLPHQVQVRAGVQNLLNQTQPSPLRDAANPFGAYFDTSWVYGPMQGRRFWMGIRWELP